MNRKEFREARSNANQVAHSRCMDRTLISLNLLLVAVWEFKVYFLTCAHLGSNEREIRSRKVTTFHPCALRFIGTLSCGPQRSATNFTLVCSLSEEGNRKSGQYQYQ